MVLRLWQGTAFRERPCPNQGSSNWGIATRHRERKGPALAPGLRKELHLESTKREPCVFQVQAGRFCSRFIGRDFKCSSRLQILAASYSGCSLPAGAATPRKTRTARFSRTMSSSARRPTRTPIFAFGTVDLIHHQSAESAQTVRLAGLDGQTK